MKIAKIKIENFRGISKGKLLFSGHTALVGDNNTGKSTVLEAIDLVLGPERLARRPIIDEHDFYAGRYIDAEGNPIPIRIELIIIDLNEDQTRHFRDHLEWWDDVKKSLLIGPPPEDTDKPEVSPALRLFFTGGYDKEEDDFIGNTYFFSPDREDGTKDTFRTYDKRFCGFLFLRTHRTGSRALSLERGSLLDIILRLQEKRLKMWEEVLVELRKISVAEQPELGVSSILSNVQNSVRSFVTAEWANNPHIRVSDLTRESLRRALTVFMSTGTKGEDGKDHSAPFQHQGTGTINTLVLALLSLIAELKQNVIFAMEEPEIALPPHAQKRIIDSVCNKSAQAIFTSHSPFVLEEFNPSQVLVLKRETGQLSGTAAEYPPSIKPKSYRSEFRSRFCESLLAKRVLVTEGRTEYDAFPAAARRLHEINPDKFKTLEALGIAVIDANSYSQIKPIGEYFTNLGKLVFAVFDKHSTAEKELIKATVPHAYEAPEKGFEDVLINGVADSAIQKYGLGLVTEGEWPPHLNDKAPKDSMDIEDLRSSIKDYLKWAKGSGGAADLLGLCSTEEMPEFVVKTLEDIQRVIEGDPAANIASEPESKTPTGTSSP